MKSKKFKTSKLNAVKKIIMAFLLKKTCRKKKANPFPKKRRSYQEEKLEV